MDSCHGVQKDGEAVHRRRTMEMSEPTPIRAAILHGQVGRRRRTTEDGVGGERDGVGTVEDEEMIDMSSIPKSYSEVVAGSDGVGDQDVSFKDVGDGRLEDDDDNRSAVGNGVGRVAA